MNYKPSFAHHQTSTFEIQFNHIDPGRDEGHNTCMSVASVPLSHGALYGISWTSAIVITPNHVHDYSKLCLMECFSPSITFAWIAQFIPCSTKYTHQNQFPVNKGWVDRGYIWPIAEECYAGKYWIEMVNPVQARKACIYTASVYPHSRNAHMNMKE